MCIRDRNRVLKEIKEEVKVEANSSKLVSRYRLGELGIENPERVVLYLKFEYEGGISRNRLWLVRHRDVRFSTTSLELEVKEVRREGEEAVIEVEVASKGYSRLTYVDIVEDCVAVADDNFFDLIPGEKRRITLRVKEPCRRLTVTAAAYNAPTPVKRVVELTR